MLPQRKEITEGRRGALNWRSVGRQHRLALRCDLHPDPSGRLARCRRRTDRSDRGEAAKRLRCSDVSLLLKHGGIPSDRLRGDSSADTAWLICSEQASN
ncbi:hypothetical protein CgunFtcFv8_016981 [Champsocephalus gunnari]|uniref:Uncharacterized protein n=1 Tax=Champsocephalus gunnari TaxID=52237 RepID=A0AAN8CRM6_CHAGU|nr:hypothetical protein CgunFtcFv8_016981 [Champsocephalus gunnari]